MKISLIFLTFFFFFNAFVCAQKLQYVQPLSGTAASTTPAALKHGEGTEHNANTIPAVGLPFAMTQWTPYLTLALQMLQYLFDC